MTLLIAVIAIWVLPSNRAAAQFCASNRIPTFTVSSMNAGSYDPFLGHTPAIVTVTIRVTRACAISLTFFRNPTTAVMSQGASTLQYQIEAVGGGNSYISLTGFVPSPANRIDIVTSGPSTVTLQVQVRVLPSQVVASGNYSDLGITPVLISQNAGLWFIVKQTTATPSVVVANVCQLGTPSPATLTFTSAEIPNALPNPGVVKSAALSASCTAPALLSLTGSALTPVAAIPAAAGFDNFINYTAQGSFGAASVTLSTTTTVATASSASRNVASGATPTGSVSVDVNLVPSQPVIAGTYTGVLTVTIDPTP